MIDKTTSAADLRALAQAAIGQQDLVTAARILHRVVNLEPRSAEDWHTLAIVLFKTENFVQACESYRRALTLQPRNARWRQEYAIALSPVGRFAQALTQHRKAITDGAPQPEGSWTEIARIHERMRQPDLARKAVEKAIELNPRYAPAYEALGRLEVAAGNLEIGKAHYIHGLAVADDPLRKASIQHRIGALLEKERDWDGAFEAHRKANHTLSRSVDARNSMRVDLSPTQDELSAENAGAYYAKWATVEFDDGLPTPVFLMGFPRSGTTLTEQVIAALPGFQTTDEHSFVSPVTQRALEMFERMMGDQADFPEGLLDRLDLLTPGQLTELRTIYWNEVWKVVGTEARDQGIRVLDKHPLRILDLGMVSRLFPKAKVITMIRDPRDCCISAFFQNLGVTPVSVRFLTLEALGDVYDRIMGFWVGVRDKLSIGWMEMRYEDLVSDFEGNARRLVEFIGEPWDDRVLEFHKRAAKRTIATPSFEAVTEKVNTRAVGKWARYERHIGPLVERVRPYLELFGYEE